MNYFAVSYSFTTFTSLHYMLNAPICGRDKNVNREPK